MRALAGLLFVLLACHEDDHPCANGTCVCPAGGDCNLPCAAPPCHIDCGPDSVCDGECANGTCTCREGATCSLECDAPPCHVACEGDHPQCNGECANGTCSCGEHSSCAFLCEAPPCHADCSADSTCTLECPSGYGDGCDFTSCVAGEPVVCPGGLIAACNTPCP